MSRRLASLIVVLLAAQAAIGAAPARAQDAGPAPLPYATLPTMGTPPPRDAALPGGVPLVHPSTPEEAAADASLATPAPSEWLSAGSRGCVRRGAMRGMCTGPRRVPRPFGADGDSARALGLGTSAVAARLLTSAPEPRWVSAAASETGAAMPGDLLFPVAGAELWRGYGATRRGRRRHNHQGVDLGASAGTLFRAANDGLVAYSDNGLRGYGNLVILVHADASTTFYAHCRATYVFAGQRVRRGQVLGEVGSTGYARGEHLHFEWHSGGMARNPLGHFAALPSGVTPTASQLEDRALPLDPSVFHRARGRRGVRAPAPRHGRAQTRSTAPIRARSRLAP